MSRLARTQAEAAADRSAQAKAEELAAWLRGRAENLEGALPAPAVVATPGRAGITPRCSHFPDVEPHQDVSNPLSEGQPVCRTRVRGGGKGKARHDGFLCEKPPTRGALLQRSAAGRGKVRLRSETARETPSFSRPRAREPGAGRLRSRVGARLRSLVRAWLGATSFLELLDLATQEQVGVMAVVLTVDLPRVGLAADKEDLISPHDRHRSRVVDGQ